MPFKKIKLQICDCCPYCKGKGGIEFFLLAKVKCVNFYGCDPSESIQLETIISKLNIKTAVCIHCGKRIEILGD